MNTPCENCLYRHKANAKHGGFVCECDCHPRHPKPASDDSGKQELLDEFRKKFVDESEDYRLDVLKGGVCIHPDKMEAFISHAFDLGKSLGYKEGVGRTIIILEKDLLNNHPNSQEMVEGLRRELAKPFSRHQEDGLKSKHSND